MKNKLCHPSRRLRRLYLLLSGVLLGLCVTFPTAVGAVAEWFAAVPAALAVYALAEEEKLRYFRVWGLGVLFTMAEYLVNYHWFIRMYPLDFTGMSRGAAVVVIFLGWWGLSFLAAIVGGLCFALEIAVSRTPVCRRFPALRAFSAGALFAVFEWTQTQTWMGVPWGRLALGQLAGNFTISVMPASLFGSYFITFLIISAAFLLADGLAHGTLRGRAIVAAVLILSDLAVGTLLFFLPDKNPQTVTAAVVQGNINSRDKWDSSASAATNTRYQNYTEQAAAAGADFILYPETAYPYYVTDGGSYDLKFAGLAQKCGAAVICGCFSTSADGEGLNVLRFYPPDGTGCAGIYAKRHLVPFGEYLPWRGFFTTFVKPLTELAMLGNDLAAGTSARPVSLNGVRYGSLICFDSIYETLALDSAANGAEILLISTNDSWFLDSRGVFMHNGQARLRAIETCRPIARAANTGISAVIDSRGRVLDELPPLTEGMIVCPVSTSSTRTLYTATGNLFVVLCALFVVSLGTADLILKKYS